MYPLPPIFPFLKNHGILGLNARNLLYIKPFNPKKAVAFADDKIKTKAFLSARGVPVAKIYARIDDHQQLLSFDFSRLPDECVLKPNNGFGGEGIKLLRGRKNGVFMENGKRPLSKRDLIEHIEDILDGKYSLGGHSDSAFFEKILMPHPGLVPFRPAGLPDIRIVVFNLVPVMAMLRIPTPQSQGKANTHLGGIGIGIDIAKGTTTYATQFNKRVHELPHGIQPSGIPIPHWEEMLLIASRIQYITNIGYLAVDLTLDADQGPVLLEVNARAGLMVQVANLAPLRSRLERVSGLKVQTPEKGVALAQELFGAKVQPKKQDAEQKKPVLGIRETITITGSGTSIEAPVLIAPEKERTQMDPAFVQDLVEGGVAEEEKGEEGLFRVKFTLGGKKMQTVVRSALVEPASVKALIGRRDLAGFLIDPSKSAASSMVRTAVKEDWRAIDKLLCQMDEELSVLRHVKPENLTEEWEKAQQDPLYNPYFHYRSAPSTLDEMENRLQNLNVDDSPFGILCKKKRRELLQRITLIRARGNPRAFTDASASLYGTPTSVLLTAASSYVQHRGACDLPIEGDDMTAEEAAQIFRDTLTMYGLHDWDVIIREHTVARCTVGGKKVTLRSTATFSKQFLPALIAHEIETHVLTAENGNHQPYELFRRGLANYLDTQEGLAIYNQNRFLTEHHEKRYGPARSLLAVAYAMEHSFAETRTYLHTELGYSQAKALSKAIDVKRGIANTEDAGGFTKGIVYYRGLRAVEQYLQAGGKMEALYIGKIALEDMDTIAQIPDIKPPLSIPMFLREKKDEKVKSKVKAKSAKGKEERGERK